MKSHVNIDDDASVVDEANAYAEGSVFRSLEDAGSAVDNPGGGVDDLGGGNAMIWAPLTISPFYFDFLKEFRVVCLLFFDNRNLFFVAFGQVDSDVMGALDVDCATG